MEIATFPVIYFPTSLSILSSWALCDMLP